MTDLLDLISEGEKEKTSAPKKKLAPAGKPVGGAQITSHRGTNGILIVGECPTFEDVRNGSPFTGNYKNFVKGLFADAGVDFDACSKTYAIRHQAPQGNPSKLVWLSGKNVKQAPGVEQHFETLRAFIEETRPHTIIALGNIALYALTGELAATKWRGSQLFYGPHRIHLVPTLSPGIAMKKFDWTYLIKMDIRRAINKEQWHEPDYRFTVRPSFILVRDKLNDLIALAEKGTLRLAVDLETRAGHTACCGIAWSKLDALCIPFMKAGNVNGYWQPGEERIIILLLRELFSHPNTYIITQNGSYDVQYWFRWWFCDKLPDFDTMIAHHVCWAGLKKSLDFLSSMYCNFHQYWKDDGKNFDIEHHNEEQLWRYNCKDCVITFECAEVLADLVEKFGLTPQVEFQTKRNLRMTVRMMLRGVRRNAEEHQQLQTALWEAASERLSLIREYVGRELNPKSPKQMQELFYDELGQQVNIHRQRKNITTDDDALTKIGKRTPLLRPLCNAILDYRSIGVLSSTFIGMQPDIDGRIRCSYNVAGTETYRYSSSENAFGSGGNLQNIPNPDKERADKERYKAPNVKAMFSPDPGYEIADFDLDRADLQVVVWESGEPLLKQLLRLGVDLHLANAQVIFNLPYTMEDLRDPILAAKIKKDYGPHRDFAKAFVHGTNYGGSARTMATAAHCSIMEAETAQDKWFTTYPGIREWQNRVERDLMEQRCVYNQFGFRRYYFDRIEGILPQALAWIPQSTVAIVIDEGMCNVSENLTHLDCQPLLQVHDSGVFQYPVNNRIECLDAIRKEMEIVVPYDDPLIIPVGAKVSDYSWGHCKEWDFDTAA